MFRTKRPPLPQTTGVSHRMVQAGEIRMHVVEAGDEDAPPVLLLHGWPQNWFAYRKLIPNLAERYHVIAPDLRGWGETDAPDGAYAKPQMAADVIALIEALDLTQHGKVRLIGHDWGSIIGFLVCVERPDLIDRYIALGGAHVWVKPGVKQIVASRKFWYQFVVATPGLGPRAVRSRRFLKLLYKRWAASGTEWSDSDFDALTGHLREPARARASSHVYRTWLTKELVPVLAGRFRKHTLQTRTLFLHGEADRCIDPAYVTPTKRAPNMTIELLPGVGHFVAEEAPDITLARALAFFA